MAASKRKKSRPYRISEGSETPERSETATLALRLGWLGLCGLWVFGVISLLGFDRGDPPTHAVWPVNDPVANWAGPVGAVVAYHGLKLLGLGIAVPLAFWLAALVIWARRGRVSQPVLRFVGVVMVTAAASGFAALAFPAWGPLPGLAGGTAGTAAVAELLERFALAGTAVWLALLAAVGLLVSADRLILWAPMALVRALVPAAARAGRTTADLTSAVASRTNAATDRTVGAASKSGGVLRRLMRVLRRRPSAPPARMNDLDEPIELERAAEPSGRSRRPAKAAPAVVPERVPEEDAEEDVDDAWDAEDWEDDDWDEDADAEADEADDVAGAPQVFDRDKLREKIQALPVRFAQANKELATDADLADIQNVAELEGYRFPTMDLLENPEADFSQKLEGLVREQAEALEAALQEYRIDGEVVDIESGPVITLYHVRLAPGTKVAAINTISSDLARSLRAVNIRVVSNMEGRDTIGIEVPNPTKEKVRLKELMSKRDRFEEMKLPMFLGKDASGEPLIADLTKMPHMLIAGTTGSGKSVCMNTIIMGFLYTRKPNELKLVLVDPKMVEMSQFKDIPHLMCPVVTEMAKAAAILEWAVAKMDERYELLAEAGCRDIAGYNELEWDELKERMGVETDEEAVRIPRRLPYMVFIIDELADLMMTNKEVEGAIIRIAQKARAVGIHLILATQRPQANVVTGLIKSNMPCRIAFKVSSGMDSRIVLDQKGGELLLGMGDMLYLSPSSHKLSRAQGTLVDDKEIRRVVKHLRDVARPSFERQLVQMRGGTSEDEQRINDSRNNSSASLAAAQEDPMFDRAVEIVLETRRGSVSLLQRRLAIGYTRASRLIDLMGIAGIISDHKGSVARDVLITPEEWEAIKAMAAEELAAQQAGGAPDQTTLFGAGSEDADAEGVEAPPFDVDEDATAVEVNGTVEEDDGHGAGLVEVKGAAADEAPGSAEAIAAAGLDEEQDAEAFADDADDDEDGETDEDETEEDWDEGAWEEEDVVEEDDGSDDDDDDDPEPEDVAEDEEGDDEDWEYLDEDETEEVEDEDDDGEPGPVGPGGRRSGSAA